MKTQQITYVVALMHCALLLAAAQRHTKLGNSCVAEDFKREADRVSLSIFNRAATELT